MSFLIPFRGKMQSSGTMYWERNLTRNHDGKAIENVMEGGGVFN